MAKRRVRRWVFVVLATTVVPLASPSVVEAQAPEAVRDGQVAPGVYVGTNPVDPIPLAATVERARAAGVELVVVVAEDPRPDADAFATRVRQLGVGDPVLVFGPGGQVGVSSDTVDGSDLVRAQEEASAAATPDRAASAFVDILLHEEDTGIPDLVTDVVRFGALALAVLVVTALADRSLRRRRRDRRRRTAVGTG